MSFTVEWKPTAQDDLTEIWLTSSDRDAVTAASATIDFLLASDPFQRGRHLAEGLWLIDIPPLLGYYTIDSERRHVEVTNLARTA